MRVCSSTSPAAMADATIRTTTTLYNGSASALVVTDRITVYYKGALIYGTEP